MVKDNSNSKTPANKKSRLSQSDVPRYEIGEALRIAYALAENYASDPTTPLNVAIAMDNSPTSSKFQMLTGASIAYGLTEGGYNASQISLTDLGKKIVSPTEEGMEIEAKIEAFLKPRIISDFMTKYDNSSIPSGSIAQNVLNGMGVPKDRTESTLEMILTGANQLGLLSDIKGKKYVNMAGRPNPTEETIIDKGEVQEVADVIETSDLKDHKPDNTSEKIDDSKRLKRVFITHGKNKDFIEPIKKLLAFGELEPLVSVDKQSVSKPVPEKVMDDMRSCGAAIIHVVGEQKLMDQEAKEHTVLNQNVLIEIGAAMALYRKRFILLVKDGVSLPSNLQGLYEVRYSGDELDGNATIKLMEAINELKKLPL